MIWIEDTFTIVLQGGLLGFSASAIGARDGNLHYEIINKMENKILNDHRHD